MLRDGDFIRILCKYDAYAFEYAPDDLCNNRAFALNTIKRVPYMFESLNDEFKTDPEFITTAYKRYQQVMVYADTDLAYRLVKQSGKLLIHCSDEIKHDRKIVLTAIKNYGLSLQHVDNIFKCDRKIALNAIKQNHKAFKYIDEKLRSDLSFMIAAVETNPNIIPYTSIALRSCKEFMLAAIKTGADFAFDYADDILHSDREIVTTSIKCQKLYLDSAPLYHA